MSIPQEILKLKPKNTRVKATARPNEYDVILRTSVWDKNKKRAVPKECGKIGCIKDGVYYELPKNNEQTIDSKEYGRFAFANKLSYDIFEDLLKVYDVDDSKKIYLIALLRAINADLKDEAIYVEYQTSFASEVFPKVGLSSNTISSFLDRIGKSTTQIDEFLLQRISKMNSKNSVVDGMLKNNTSDTNNMSEHSRKSRTKGSDDISLLYSYDLDIDEPIAYGVYPGNMLDHVAFDNFIDTYNIENGFVILDKGFDVSRIKTELNKRNIGYLVTIKESRKEIVELSLNKGFDGGFVFEDDTIRYKKVEHDGKFYYSFVSTEKSSSEQKRYLDKKIKDGKYQKEEWVSKEDYFGLIIFESNKDMNAISIYKAYKNRWEIENLFRKYKNIIDRSEVNVHGVYRLYATEFINFISSIMTMRIKKELDKRGLSKKYSQPQVMNLLSKVRKRRCSRRKDKWEFEASLIYIKDIVKILDL